MQKTVSFLAALSILLFAPLAGAFQVDFIARINNVDQGDGAGVPAPRLIAVAAFDNIQLSTRGTVSITYTVINGAGTTVFNDTATIAFGQTQVTVGNASTGRLTLTYDGTIDRLEARYVLNIFGSFGPYDITVQDDGPNWRGVARISSSILL